MCYRIRQVSDYVVVMENQNFSLWRKEINMNQLSFVNCYGIRQVNDYGVVMENQNFSPWRKELYMNQLSLVNCNCHKFELGGKLFHANYILSF